MICPASRYVAPRAASSPLQPVIRSQVCDPVNPLTVIPTKTTGTQVKVDSSTRWMRKPPRPG
ncbi:hypothetical protein [Streptomyces vinaceus]|uniref:hypothetical protein n=1 Tax=Streptomyces vinaceus TaxID=1960 RepID=UPI00382FAECC